MPEKPIQVQTEIIENSPDKTNPAYWVDVIKDAHKRTVEAIFEVGRLLNEAQNYVSHGNFGNWVDANLPFSSRTAERYMRVYENLGYLLSDPTRVSYLPASLRGCEELAIVRNLGGEKEIDKLFKNNEISPDLTSGRFSVMIKELRQKQTKSKSTITQTKPPAPPSLPPPLPKNYKVVYSKTFENAFNKVSGQKFDAIIADPRKMSDIKINDYYDYLYKEMEKRLEPGGFLAIYIPPKSLKEILATFKKPVKIGVRSTKSDAFIDDDDFSIVIMNTDYTKPTVSSSHNIVEQYCIPYGSVLDLFCESSTHGKSCVESDKTFLGFNNDQTKVSEAHNAIHWALSVNTQLKKAQKVLEKYSDFEYVTDNEKHDLIDVAAKILKTPNHPSGLSVTLENILGEKSKTFENFDDFYDFLREKKRIIKGEVEIWNLYPDAYVADCLIQYYEADVHELKKGKDGKYYSVGEETKRTVINRLEKWSAKVGTKSDDKLFNSDLFDAAAKALAELKK